MYFLLRSTVHSSPPRPSPGSFAPPPAEPVVGLMVIGFPKKDWIPQKRWECQKSSWIYWTASLQDSRKLSLECQDSRKLCKSSTFSGDQWTGILPGF